MKQRKVWQVMMGVFLPLLLLAWTENWVYRYNGPGNSSDGANSIVYGADGNIYAAGNSYGSGTDADFTVISLTTTGDTNWVYRYNGPGSVWDRANSLVYGADGNIYAAGYSYGSGTDADFTVISLTTTGDTNWVYRYNGPGNLGDEAFSIVYGADGNIYAAGFSDAGYISADFTVVSLTTAGDTNWVYRYHPGEEGGVAYSIVYGADGNIYAAGFSSDSVEGEDYYTVFSLTTAGDTNWVYRYRGPENGSHRARSIVYGADGNIYAAGESRGSGTNKDFMVISLTTAGDTNWVYRYDGPGSVWDRANSIVYGADGNIYAAGYSYVSGTAREDFTVISLTTAGDTNWVYRYNGPGRDIANSLVYGADDNIYAVGYINGVSSEFTVISLTTAGDTNWVYRYNDGEADAIVYGADGNIYAAGNSYGSGTDADFTVISLSPDIGVQEQNTIVRNTIFGATIFSGPLLLPEGKKCKVFDITGRVVEPTKITRGIYFIEVDGVVTQKVVKVR